ncbi:MAG TPA: TIGR03435 family protein [Bryobacteraceae bacterium]|nr:TIGR03435 family protein [Bryobacteraceae bacterium]
MRLRLLVLSFTLGVFGGMGQTGAVSAGDFAPDLIFTKVLSPPGASWSSSNLMGRVTVLALFPDTSHNLQSVLRWNAQVGQFADRGIQFVWITSEAEETLDPWLQEHPLLGWVLHDPEGASRRAYGMELPDGVIIGTDRRILGFDPQIVPSQRTLNAALEGSGSTLHTIARRLPPPDDHKPNFTPSYELHISPAHGEGGNFGGDNFQSYQGYDLKDLLAALYDVNPVRIHLPALLDDGKRYDFAILLPRTESREMIVERMRRGVEAHFGMKLERETRVMDTYIVTADVATANGKLSAAKKRHDDDGGFSHTSSVEFQVARPHGDISEVPKAVGLADIRGISVEGDMNHFCHALEGSVDRPVVNESNLPGEFKIDVRANPDGDNDFLDRLHRQTGIVITPAQRPVEILVLQPR